MIKYRVYIVSGTRRFFSFDMFLRYLQVCFVVEDENDEEYVLGWEVIKGEK